MPYAPGTNTGHGHVWARPDGVKVRCGGPAMCKECASDLVAKTIAEEKPATVQLSDSQRFMLDWLSKEDSSAYGECRGSDLDRLIALGLAWKAPRQDGGDEDYCRVSLTVDGWRVFKMLSPSQEEFEAARLRRAVIVVESLYREKIAIEGRAPSAEEIVKAVLGVLRA